MWKIIFILWLFAKETTAHPSFLAVGHVVRGRVSAGAVKRSQCAVPSPMVTSGGTLATVSRAWKEWESSALVVVVSLFPLPGFFGPWLH